MKKFIADCSHAQSTTFGVKFQELHLFWSKILGPKLMMSVVSLTISVKASTYEDHKTTQIRQREVVSIAAVYL